MKKSHKAGLCLGCLLTCAFVLLAAARPSHGQSNSEKTLASFKKIDDFPLYVMDYHGDYGFAEYLKRGVRPSLDADAPTGEASPPAAAPPWACSCFVVRAEDGRILVGRNFDWRVHPALLLFTRPPKAFASMSMVDISYLGFGRSAPSEENMKQLLQAPFLPFDGLNERGLAVTMMAVPSSEGGREPKKVTIDSLAVIRLMLDYADTVARAIDLVSDYNVDFGGGPPIHYLIADASGDSAVIEYLNDRMRVVRGDGKFQASTNFLQFPDPPQNGRTDCWRYNRIFERLSRAEGRFSTDDGMDLLQSVAQTGDHPTIWSCLYDLSARDVRVVMGRNYGRVHQFGFPSGEREGTGRLP